MVQGLANIYEVAINSNNVIDLGYKNGWDKVTKTFFDSIQMYKIPESSTSKTIGNSVTEYSAEYQDDITDEIYIVISKVDSGD
jgi:hypothetical protein